LASSYLSVLAVILENASLAAVLNFSYSNVCCEIPLRFASVSNVSASDLASRRVFNCFSNASFSLSKVVLLYPPKDSIAFLPKEFRSEYFVIVSLISLILLIIFSSSDLAAASLCDFDMEYVAPIANTPIANPAGVRAINAPAAAALSVFKAKVSIAAPRPIIPATIRSMFSDKPFIALKNILLVPVAAFNVPTYLVRPLLNTVKACSNVF